MALERNNTALEFETMLRRHLSQGGAPVSACAGFDADIASAYLERALESAACARFETHLAGCAACRRHIIELSRLSQLGLQTTAQASPAAAAAGFWAWRSKVRELFDRRFNLPSWRWNWRLTGTAVAACAALLTVMIARPWRQSLQPAAPALNVALDNKADSPVATAAALSSPSPTADAKAEELSKPNESTPANPAIAQNGPQINTQIARSEAQSNMLGAGAGAVPTPKLTAAQTNNNASSAATSLPVIPENPSRLLQQDFALGQAQPESMAAAPLAAPQMGQRQEPLQGRPPSASLELSQRRAVAETADAAGGTDKSAKSEERETSRAKLRSVPSVTPRTPPNPAIAPNPEDNPMQSESLNGSRDGRRVSVPPIVRPIRKFNWYEILMGYMPFRKPDLEEKPPPPKEKDKDNDDETVKDLTRKVRDKTFTFQKEGGVWVDHAYKREIMAFRRVRLVPGTKEYESVVTAEPQLTEFFSMGHVIVVWKDKVYEVVKR